MEVLTEFLDSNPLVCLQISKSNKLADKLCLKVIKEDIVIHELTGNTILECYNGLIAHTLSVGFTAILNRIIE